MKRQNVLDNQNDEPNVDYKSEAEVIIQPEEMQAEHAMQKKLDNQLRKILGVESLFRVEDQYQHQHECLVSRVQK